MNPHLRLYSLHNKGANLAKLTAGAAGLQAAAPTHRRGHSTGSIMHQRQPSAGSMVDLGKAFDCILAAAPSKGDTLAMSTIKINVRERDPYARPLVTCNSSM